MPTGMLHVTKPTQSLEADFQGPCDFIHLYVAADYLRSRHGVRAEPDRSLSEFMVRDPICA